MLNPLVDEYLNNGCMRCKYGGTPSCKVHLWQEEIKLLRRIALDSQLKEEIKAKEKIIQEYIQEAIQIEESGEKIIPSQNVEPIPKELEDALEQDPLLKKAFFALTPGRQRGYILHFSQPKQSETRKRRIEKYTKQIINGIGLHDR